MIALHIANPRLHCRNRAEPYDNMTDLIPSCQRHAVPDVLFGTCTFRRSCFGQAIWLRVIFTGCASILFAIIIYAADFVKGDGKILMERSHTRQKAPPSKVTDRPNSA